MTIEGLIKDKKTGKEIPGTITAVSGDGTPIGVTSLRPGERYFITGDEDYIRNATLVVVSPGYTMLRVLGDWLTMDGNIYLEKDNAAVLILATAGVGLALVAARRDSKGGKRRVGSAAAAAPMVIETVKKMPTPVLLGVSVAMFFVMKSILEKVGIWKSADEKQLDRLSEDPNNFWNPNFWQTKPANVSYTNPIDATTATQYARDIYDGLSWMDDDEDKIKGVFKRLYSQASASFVAYYFNKQYNKDLLKTLIGGWWPNDGLSDSDVTEINNYISRLPKY